MPYASDKQRRYFHAQEGKKVPSSVVKEFDDAERAKRGGKMKATRDGFKSYLKKSNEKGMGEDSKSHEVKGEMKCESCGKSMKCPHCGK